MITHTLIYLLARGIPGIINLIAIAVYTRLLTPDDFGKYALTIALSSLLSSVLFQWLTMGILRFLPGNNSSRDSIVSTVIFSFIIIVVITAILGGFLYMILPPSFYKSSIPLCLILFWLLGLFEMTMQIVTSSFLPVRYGVLSILKAVMSLLTGVLFIQKGYGANGPIFGIIIGITLATMFTRREWEGIAIKKVARTRIRQFLTYGLPLTATFALSFIVSTSDRFLLNWYLGSSAAGLYAAGYDLAQQTLGMLMVIVSIASYPLVVQALELHGLSAAHGELRKQLAMLLAIAVPAAAGLAVCSRNIGEVFLGEAFRDSATIIIPWIALTTIISGLKAYYLDLSFQLGHHTIGQVHVMLACALSNIAINLILIPFLGIKGALIGSTAAYSIGFLFSLAYGRRVFTLPAPSIDSLKVLFATGIMVASLISIVHLRGKVALAIQLLTGVTIYSSCCIVFDVLGLRKKAIKMFKTA